MDIYLRHIPNSRSIRNQPMRLNTDTVIRRTDKAILYLHILAARNINTISCYNSGHDIHIINDNIQVLNGDIPVSLIRGYQTPTEEVRVHDITFDNITFMGQKCETWQDLRFVTELANDIYVNGVRTCKQMKF